MPVDLSAELDRIRRHIPCLEAAARDESAPALVRAGVTAELAAWRMAEELAERDRTIRNAPERHRTEENRGS